MVVDCGFDYCRVFDYEDNKIYTLKDYNVDAIVGFVSTLACSSYIKNIGGGKVVTMQDKPIKIGNRSIDLLVGNRLIEKGMNVTFLDYIV